jgi:hypothetical protein
VGDTQPNRFFSRLNRFVYRAARGVPFRAESDPLTPNEWLLRRIPNNADYYKPAEPVPIQRVAFEPNKQDVDGLSFFREMFISPRELGLKTGRKPPYVVARIRLKDLQANNIKIRPAPDEEQPRGHVVAPEITYPARKSTKEAQRQLRDSARLAFDPAQHVTIRVRLRLLLSRIGKGRFSGVLTTLA